MTPVEYVLDPRFEALGCAFVWEVGPAEWVDGPDLPAYLAGIDWGGVFAISHNAKFDMLVLSLRYNVFPSSTGIHWAWHGTGSHRLRSVSLTSVSEHFGMPSKMDTVHKLKGIGFEALRQKPELYAEVRSYALDDAMKCRDIFGRILRDGFPPRQLLFVDMVVRMTTLPQFEIDRNVLDAHLDSDLAHKRALLEAAELSGADIAALRSDARLAKLLISLGVPSAPEEIQANRGHDLRLR